MVYTKKKLQMVWNIYLDSCITVTYISTLTLQESHGVQLNKKIISFLNILAFQSPTCFQTGNFLLYIIQSKSYSTKLVLVSNHRASFAHHFNIFDRFSLKIIHMIIKKFLCASTVTIRNKENGKIYLSHHYKTAALIVYKQDLSYFL